KIALGPVDDLGRHDRSRRFLQDVLAALPDLETGRYARGKLDNFMIKEGHASLKPPRHGHIVDALDGIVDKHDRCVELKSLVHRRGTGNAVEITSNEFAAVIAVEIVWT